MKARCENCTWWSSDDGEWGVCTLSDPDNQYDEDASPIRARTINGIYESIVETRKDFSCSEFEAFEDGNA